MINKVTSCNFESGYGIKQKSQKSDNIAFTGLTDRMGKKIYNGFYDMTALFPRENMQSPITGRLPGFMITRIKARTTDIGGAVKEVMDAFAKTCRELRAFEPTSKSTVDEIKYRRSDSTVKDLRATLEKWGILSRFDDFNISYIGKGGKGSVFKFDGLKHIEGTTEDEYVMKVFHTTSVQANAYHGCFPEMNAATYWMKKLGYDTNRGKFFWGDVKDAYMINKFIDEDVRLPKKIPNPYINGVKFTDEDAVHIHNICKGYSYDWGGGVVINQSVNSNKYARRIMRDVLESEGSYRMGKWNQIFGVKANGNVDTRNAGLALSIQYLPMDHRVWCFEQCLSRAGKYTKRALAYTLKFLPYEDSVKFYELLASRSSEPVLKKILVNEIPLLSMKDEYRSSVKDDLLVLSSVDSSVQKKIDNEKLKLFKGLAEKYIPCVAEAV